jgi:hypothetical protein
MNQIKEQEKTGQPKAQESTTKHQKHQQPSEASQSTNSIINHQKHPTPTESTPKKLKA